MGPKRRATLSVPLYWTENNAIVIMTVMARMVICFISVKPGISGRPSTAERILIAGVITPSPSSSDMPTYPRNVAKPKRRPFFK